MQTKRKHEGYLFIDNRNAPPLSDEALRATGKDFIGGRGLLESATNTCSHCQTIVVLNPDRSRPRGYCRKCDHYVCDNPACNRNCKPFAQILDEAEAKARTALIV
jgi:hypothetical protein